MATPRIEAHRSETPVLLLRLLVEHRDRVVREPAAVGIAVRHDRERVAERERHHVGGSRRADHGDVKDGAKRAETRVAHRIDADRVVAVLLRADARLVHTDIREQPVVRAIEVGAGCLDRPVVELNVRAEADPLLLRPAILDAAVAERERNDDQDLVHELSRLAEVIVLTACTASRARCQQAGRPHHLMLEHAGRTMRARDDSLPLRRAAGGGRRAHCAAALRTVAVPRAVPIAALGDPPDRCSPAMLSPLAGPTARSGSSPQPNSACVSCAGCPAPSAQHPSSNSTIPVSSPLPSVTTMSQEPPVTLSPQSVPETQMPDIRYTGTAFNRAETAPASPRNSPSRPSNSM